MSDRTVDWAALRAPFPAESVRFRAGPTTADRTRALALPYIDRVVLLDRLDDALGPENWEDEYDLLGPGAALCRLRIRVEDEWLVKSDVGEAGRDEEEAAKSAATDALKRAATKFGVGRELYALPRVWVAYDARRRELDVDEARRQVFGAAAVYGQERRVCGIHAGAVLILNPKTERWGHVLPDGSGCTGELGRRPALGTRTDTGSRSRGGAGQAPAARRRGRAAQQ